MKHPEWLWATALLALLFAGYGLIPAPRGNDSADSFDEDGGGKKAFFLLAQNLLPGVQKPPVKKSGMSPASRIAPSSSKVSRTATKPSSENEA